MTDEKQTSDAQVLANECKRWRKHADGLTVEVARLNSYIEVLNQDKRKLEGLKDIAQRSIAEMRVELAASNAARDGYAQTVQRQQDQVTALQLQGREYEARVDRLSEELEDTTARLGTLQAANAALQTEVDRWRAAAGGKVPADPDPDPQPDPEPDPDPRPRPDPGGDEPWTFAWFGKSAAEKKNARPPGWDEFGFGGEESSFENLPADESFGLFGWSFSELPHYVQKAISNGARAGAEGVHGALERIWLENPPDGLKWLARIYNLASLRAHRVGCEGHIGSTGRPAPKEHLIYACVHGATSFTECFAHGLGGKLLYVAHRPYAAKGYPPQNLFYTDAPEHIARGNVAIDCEMDASRGSYSFTWFDAGDHENLATIVMDQNVCVAEWKRERSQGLNDFSAPSGDLNRVQSCGAFTTSNYVYFGQPHTIRRFELTGNLIHLTRGKHPIGNVRDAKHIVIRDNCIETTGHQNPRIEINTHDSLAKGMSPPEVVEVENNVSDGAIVRVQEADGTMVTHPLHTPGKRYIYTRATRRFMEV